MKILRETKRMIYAERPDGKKVILLKSYHKKTIRRIYRKRKTSVPISDLWTSWSGVRRQFVNFALLHQLIYITYKHNFI